MCQYNTVNWYFPRDQCNILQNHTWVKKSIQSEDILMGFSCMETQKTQWYGFRLHIGTNL